MRRHEVGCPGVASAAVGCGLKRGSHREREKCTVSGPGGRPCTLHFNQGSWHPPDPLQHHGAEGQRPQPPGGWKGRLLDPGWAWGLGGLPHPVPSHGFYGVS